MGLRRAISSSIRFPVRVFHPSTTTSSFRASRATMTRSLGKCCNNSGDAAVPMIISPHPRRATNGLSPGLGYRLPPGSDRSRTIPQSPPDCSRCHCRIQVDHSNRAQSAELAGNITRSTGREGSFLSPINWTTSPP